MSLLLQVRPALRATIDAAVALLLPRSCVACEGQMADSEQGVVCGACWSRLAFLPHPQCERCGHPTQGTECRYCELFPPFVRAARSVCWVPHEAGSAIVHALKYHEWHAAAAGMAERMARLSWPRDVLRERSAVVPVPLSRTRARERGFNQAELVAAGLSSRWRVPLWTDVLRRGHSSGSQTRLTPDARAANVVTAFTVPANSPVVRAKLAGRHIVLVDDVLTTGATLNACAAALFEAGARIVSYATFGRARAAGDR